MMWRKRKRKSQPSVIRHTNSRSQTFCLHLMSCTTTLQQHIALQFLFEQTHTHSSSGLLLSWLQSLNNSLTLIIQPQQIILLLDWTPTLQVIVNFTEQQSFNRMHVTRLNHFRYSKVLLNENRKGGYLIWDQVPIFHTSGQIWAEHTNED